MKLSIEIVAETYGVSAAVANAMAVAYPHEIAPQGRQSVCRWCGDEAARGAMCQDNPRWLAYVDHAALEAQRRRQHEFRQRPDKHNWTCDCRECDAPKSPIICRHCGHTKDDGSVCTKREAV